MNEAQWKDQVDRRLQLQTQQINALAGLVQADEAYKELGDRLDALEKSICALQTAVALLQSQAFKDAGLRRYGMPNQ